MKKQITTFLFFASITFSVIGQVSTNYAGIGYLNLLNDKFTTQQNTGLKEAYLNLPEGIGIDTTGKILFSHWNRIMIIDNGNLRGRAGGAGNPTFSSGYNIANGIQGRFSEPRGIDVNPITNEIFVCDYGNYVIRKISPFINVSNTQLNSLVAGVPNSDGLNDGTALTAKFKGPYDIVIMANGDMYVSDDNANNIRKISGGQLTTVAGSTAGISGDANGIGTAALLDVPAGMCKKDENNILFCDLFNGKVKQLNLTTLAVTTLVSNLIGPRDVAYTNGIIFITDSRELKKHENNVTTIVAGSNATPDSTAGTYAQTRFGDLRNLVFSKSENVLYILDNTYGIVKRLSLDAAPNVDFVGNPLSATVGQVVTLTDLTTNKSGSKVWSITPANYTLVAGTTLTSDAVKLEFTQTGSYAVKLTYTYTGGVVTKNQVGYINVSSINQIPVANFEADKVVTVINTNVSFLDLSANTPTSWLWEITPSAGVSFKNSTTANSKHPVMAFANSGKYTIKLTATNAFGANVSNKVEHINITLTSLEKLNTMPVVAYPNPTESEINIVNSNSFKTYTIYNLNGLAIATGTLAENKMDVAFLSNGIYSVVLASNSGLSGTFKFVKN